MNKVFEKTEIAGKKLKKSIKRSATPKGLGVLIIHGLTANPDTVRGIEPPVKALGLPTRMPVLRGHGAKSPEALRGVTWHDWLADAQSSLDDLLTESEKAIVVGHSLGGLLTLALAADNGDKIDSIILAAAAVQPASPLAPGRALHFLAPLVGALLKKWDFPPVYTDPALARGNPNYLWAPMDAVLSFLDFTGVARSRLSDVKTPTLILQSHSDSLVSPKSANIIYNGISTPAEKKQIVWFEKTNHEMFLDCERDAVADAIIKYIRSRIGTR